MKFNTTAAIRMHAEITVFYALVALFWQHGLRKFCLVEVTVFCQKHKVLDASDGMTKTLCAAVADAQHITAT